MTTSTIRPHTAPSVRVRVSANMGHSGGLKLSNCCPKLQHWQQSCHLERCWHHMLQVQLQLQPLKRAPS